MRNKCGKKMWWIGLMIPFALLAMTAFGFGFMYLWNWLIPELFAGPTITFWQGIGLLLLSKILIGHHGHWKHKKHWHCSACCKEGSDNHEKYANNWNSKKHEMKHEWKQKLKKWIEEGDKKQEGGENV